MESLARQGPTRGPSLLDKSEGQESSGAPHRGQGNVNDASSARVAGYRIKPRR